MTDLRRYHSVPVAEWKRLKNLDYPRYVRLMDWWLTCKCVTDLWYFAWYGVSYRSRAHLNAPLQRTIANWLQEWDSSIKMLLVSREHNKSQWSIIRSAWRFAGDVNRRLLIRAFNTPKAQQIAGALREIIDSEPFRRRFHWVYARRKKGSSQPSMWGNDGMMLHRDDLGIRVPSVEICGLDKNPTGGHFTDGLADDIAVADNECSELMRADLYSRHNEDTNLFLAGAQRLITGTIWYRDGFMDSARQRTGQWRDMEYDLFLQPCFEKVFDRPFMGSDVVMLDDRQTFVVPPGSEFPGINELKHHQARLTFENPSLTDTDVVIREVVENDRTHFRVNRPIETAYTTNPLAYVVSEDRPASPNKFTMDEKDELVDESNREQCNRASLPLKRKNMGPYVWSCQWLLDPVTRDTQMFDPELLQYIEPKDFKELAKKERGIWYRKCDLASAKDTGSFTSILEGWVWHDMIVCSHLFWGLPKTSEILLELFRGQIRLDAEYGAKFRHTHFETAHIEGTIRENLEIAQRDPYRYFSQIPGECARFAEKYLSERGAMWVPMATDSRGTTNKIDRIRDQIQPALGARRIYIVRGMLNEDRLVKEITDMTGQSKVGFDVADTLADLCSEAQAKPKEKKARQARGVYHEKQDRAMRSMTTRKSSLGGW